MPLLALDAALGTASAAVLAEEGIVALERDASGGRLALLAASVLRAAGLAAGDLAAVGASVGPGSFTGIRTGLALAAGIGLAAGIPVIGVSVGEALTALLPDPSPRVLWIAIDSRRGRVFLQRAGEATAFDLDGLPLPARPVLVAGDAAEVVVERLRREGADAALAPLCTSDAAGVGLAARARLAGRLPPRAAHPLYIDAPAALFPTGLRPPPV
ncbi:MAG: tRNA (adenosine(37)-N6)-threonylcarbamoyltransferase complex dimerization subunit type 1 TsaB [Rhodospirillales bacterium]|nr:tRNA (adenosine(37)-N6)-threonylcarbamoyltransferase complex dimerization subunit type 1 TsaB [Rhodospirillales bacterium]